MSKSIETIYAILEEATGLSRERLGDANSLVMNLGLAGMHGWELIDRLNEIYAIDWRDFDPYDHFGPEVGFNPFVYFWRRWKGEQQAYEAFARKVTIGHLKAVCLGGQWFDP